MKRDKKILIILLSIFCILAVVGTTLHFTKDFFFQEKEVETPKTESQILEEKGIILVNKESFVQEANSLLEKGYTADEINNIY